MTTADSPIGIFDSGVGGTSIFKEIHQLMPLEHTLYLADSKYAPYGEKSSNEIIRLSIKNTDFLIDQGCKIIVVACNTATTNAIDELRKQYTTPIIGIEPAIKPAALKTKHRSIGILATKGTLSSRLFSKTSGLFTKNIQVTEIVGKGLVEAIETGTHTDKKTTTLLKKLLQPLIDKNIDYLVLGCSHYPYLIPQLKAILPPHVQIIDSGKAVAQQTKKVLKNSNSLSTTQQARPVFYSNKNLEIMKRLIAAEKNNFQVNYLDF